MLTERQAAVRLLRILMLLALVLPPVLFALTAWIDYRNFDHLTNERIERSLAILREHSLKILYTIERTFGEINEIIGNTSDDDIRANEVRLHEKLKAIVKSTPQMHGIVITDRDGRPLVFSNVTPVPASASLADLGYFKDLQAGEKGTVVSTITRPRLGGQGPFIALAQSRPSNDGAFSGIIAISVLERYFENFYASLAETGNYFALLRADGQFLARYPVTEQSHTLRLPNDNEFRVRVAQGHDEAIYNDMSPIDQLTRRIGYRKLARYPLYVLAGVERKAIIREWLNYNINYMIFGLPLTALLVAGLGLALRRTQRLYDEAERREKAEDALRQAQRMEAIGQLTGGIAHDFNNLLMVISGSVQRLRKELSDQKYARTIEMIATATQRGETLTRQLLTFSRQQKLSPQVMDLSQRLPAIREMLMRSLGSNIEIKLDLPDEYCAVHIDPNEFELAILNLAVNAKHAMPNGGTLTIGAAPVTLTGETSPDGLAGEFVVIRVTDTGTGIPAKIMGHLFEPFFTTKEVGKGTGLGLSQVYGFTKQSGGTTTVSSVEGQGATFTLYLPRSHQKAEEPAPLVPAQVESTMTGTVLLVEDNAAVADVSAEYLRQLGYHVRIAADAKDALAALRLDAKVDLVFSDILMPGGMNGLDLAREIGIRFPGIPVLLTTGYSASAQDAVRQGVVVLQKPYDLDALRRHIREAIEAHEARRQRQSAG